MTEHSASIFVFFFLAEYASIILMCILISIVLLGGYEIFSIVKVILDILINIYYLFNTLLLSFNINLLNTENTLNIPYTYNIYALSLIYNLTIGIKTLIFVFIFI
jgi:NADH-ubiquinone oxidoreductase chain 1